MSRVGKLPINVPQGVSVSLKDQSLMVKGPKGQLSRTLPEGVDLDISDNLIRIVRQDESNQTRALHGLVRALVYNMVHGVSQGYKIGLEIHGTGYRAEAQKNVLNLSLGYSHPIQFILPEGVTAAVERQTGIQLEGIDKEVLGQTAARIRALRPVEPYKGKGIRLTGEQVLRKAGKAGSKK